MRSGPYWNDTLECWQDEPLPTPASIAKARKRDYDRARYYGNHAREVARASESSRRRAQAMFTPPWADRAAIRAIYEEAARRRAAGEDVEVDHVLPVRGATVTGFHIETNLAIVPTRENRAKGNRSAT